ncbi:MAG: histidine kinase [Saprospiraceae bacterium]
MSIHLVGVCSLEFESKAYFAYQYFSKYTRNEAEKWRLQIALRDAQLGQLRAQVQPHFLFNALNNIRALVLARRLCLRVSGFALDYLKLAPVHASGPECDIKSTLGAARPLTT